VELEGPISATVEPYGVVVLGLETFVFRLERRESLEKGGVFLVLLVFSVRHILYSPLGKAPMDSAGPRLELHQ
jgi:hypothetical protein